MELSSQYFENKASFKAELLDWIEENQTRTITNKETLDDLLRRFPIAPEANRIIRNYFKISGKFSLEDLPYLLAPYEAAEMDKIFEYGDFQSDHKSYLYVVLNEFFDRAKLAFFREYEITE